jgi:hypothetical protein
VDGSKNVAGGEPMSVNDLERLFTQHSFITRRELDHFDLVAESERLFVTVKRYDDLGQALDHLSSLQGIMVEKFFRRMQPEKLWDSYLIILTPGLADVGPEMAKAVDEILRDLAYCRKLILDETADQEHTARKLSSLLEPNLKPKGTNVDPLEALKEELRHQGISKHVLELLEETDGDLILQCAVRQVAEGAS